MFVSKSLFNLLQCIYTASSKTQFKSTVFARTSLSLTPVRTASTRSTTVVPAADDPCVCSCPPMIVIDCDATTPTPAGKNLFFLKSHYDTKMQICSGTYRLQTCIYGFTSYYAFSTWDCNIENMNYPGHTSFIWL